MTLQENIVKFGKIVSADPKLSNLKKVREIGRALVMADTLHLTDKDRGKYEHLTLSALEDSGIPEYHGVCFGCHHRGEHLSDVMKMRIMCDTLTILKDADLPLTMRYSGDVLRAVGGRSKSAEYLEYDECERILNEHFEAVPAFDEELREVFERTSFYLEELQRIKGRVNPSGTIINTDCVLDVWLPDDFKAFGFKVRIKAPKEIAEWNGSKKPYVLANNFACILDVLIKVIVRTDKSEIAQIAFLNRLQEMGIMSESCFPVGTDIGCSARGPVYVPYHFLDNQALRAMYERYFTTKQQISESSLESTFKAIRTWYKMA